MPWSKPGRWKVKVTKMTKSWEKPKAYKQWYIKKRQKSCDALYKKGFKRYLVLMQTTPISAEVLYCSASTEPEHIRIKLKMLEAGGSSYPCPCCWKGQCSAAVRPCLHPSFPTWSPSFSRLQPLGLGLAAAGLFGDAPRYQSGHGLQPVPDLGAGKPRESQHGSNVNDQRPCLSLNLCSRVSWQSKYCLRKWKDKAC